LADFLGYSNHHPNCLCFDHDRKKTKNIKHSGNITLDQVIGIARTMRFKSMAKKLEGTVKEILGSCYAIGCTVNGKTPADITAEINAGTITIPEE
jgi:large subunit ribosomal protein L12e